MGTGLWGMDCGEPGCGGAVLWGAVLWKSRGCGDAYHVLSMVSVEMKIDFGSVEVKVPLFTAIRLSSTWLAWPLLTCELTRTRMAACMMH